MSNIQETVADRAADKLHREAEAVKKTKGNGFPAVAIREMAGPIASMLVRFCYQEERFAKAVDESQGTLTDCIGEIVKLSTREKPVVSDLDAYATAVRFYLPDGKVTMSCRVILPAERDEDLFDLGTEDDEPTGGAIILELPLLD